MYDFCMTPIYAGLLALGGLLGFATKGSAASLGGGLGSAAILAACSYVSLQAFHQGRLCRPATFVSLLVSATLTYVMWQRYSRSGKMMPSGAVAVLSLIFTAFYLWNLALFNPDMSRKLRKAA